MLIQVTFQIDIIMMVQLWVLMQVKIMWNMNFCWVLEKHNVGIRLPVRVSSNVLSDESFRRFPSRLRGSALNKSWFIPRLTWNNVCHRFTDIIITQSSELLTYSVHQIHTLGNIPTLCPPWEHVAITITNAPNSIISGLHFSPACGIAKWRIIFWQSS